MRVRQRKLYKKITLLKYNVGVQAALYTKDTPTQVFVHTTDNPVWTAGKTLMPTITVEEFDTRISNEKGATIIVPNKYSKEFANSPTNNIATEVGKTKSASIYKIQ